MMVCRRESRRDAVLTIELWLSCTAGLTTKTMLLCTTPNTAVDVDVEVADPVTTVGLEKTSAAEVAEFVVVELILDINPSKLQSDV
jgi:hypothetical protein